MTTDTLDKIKIKINTSKLREALSLCSKTICAKRALEGKIAIGIGLSEFSLIEEEFQSKNGKL
jgi:hypothetical protein